MPRVISSILFSLVLSTAFTGCSVTRDTPSDNVVRLPNGRPIAVLLPSASQVASAKLPPIVGNVRAVSNADIRAAMGATTPLSTIRFIRVKDHNTIQLHHEELGDRCLHYDDMRRKKGKWTYKVTVVVVEDCGYMPM
ncbi:MAG: hypothetical protein QOJ45_1106 [Verrucomicrobiota bacterium]|jgi:hypothetical protein